MRTTADIMRQSAEITCECILPEEDLREALWASYAISVGNLYVNAATNGWGDIAEDLLAELRRHGFDVERVDGEWKLKYMEDEP